VIEPNAEEGVTSISLFLGDDGSIKRHLFVLRRNAVDSPFASERVQ
jgi:hypothetical protein